MSEKTGDVEYILAKIAAVERLITGITMAYDAPPNNINHGDAPLFINLPGPVTVEDAGSDEEAAEIYETRDYFCNLLVAPFGMGAGGEMYNRCVPFFALVRNAFLSHPSLLTNGLLRSFLRGDSGVRADLTYGGQPYYGIRFTLAVRSKVRIDYAQGE